MAWGATEVMEILFEPGVAVMAVWLLLTALCLYTLATRLTYLSLLTVPVGFVCLYAIALIGREVSEFVGMGYLSDFGQIFHPTKLKSIDVLLAGLLILTSYGFSIVTDELAKLSERLVSLK